MYEAQSIKSKYFYDTNFCVRFPKSSKSFLQVQNSVKQGPIVISPKVLCPNYICPKFVALLRFSFIFHFISIH